MITKMRKTVHSTILLTVNYDLSHRDRQTENNVIFGIWELFEKIQLILTTSFNPDQIMDAHSYLTQLLDLLNLIDYVNF